MAVEPTSQLHEADANHHQPTMALPDEVRGP
jgi:hypothetical protein